MIFVRMMHFFAATALCSSSVLPAFATPCGDEPRPQRTFVIIHTASLQSAAKEWAKYRASGQGGNWDVVLHQLKPADDVDGQRIGIRDFIRDEHRRVAAREEDFAVLLLGDCDPESPATSIPAWYFPQVDTVMRSGDGRNDQYATDHPYQLMNDKDDVPDIALGRIPAQSNDDALAALNKIRFYESPPTLEMLQSRSRARVAYTASEGRFGVMDGVLEELFKTMVDRMVPDAFDLSMIYAKSSSIYCPPPSKLRETVLNQLGSGALLFNYIGHGYESGFDSLHWGNKRFPILHVSDLQKRATANKPDDELRVSRIPVGQANDDAPSSPDAANRPSAIINHEFDCCQSRFSRAAASDGSICPAIRGRLRKNCCSTPAMQARSRSFPARASRIRTPTP
jgi:hypothetical protein